MESLMVEKNTENHRCKILYVCLIHVQSALKLNNFSMFNLNAKKALKF